MDRIYVSLVGPVPGQFHWKAMCFKDGRTTVQTAKAFRLCAAQGWKVRPADVAWAAFKEPDDELPFITSQNWVDPR